MTEFFNTFFIIPIINVLLLIYQLFAFFHIPYALGFSIIVLTIIIRLLMYPLMASQLKASKKMQAIAPHISHLKEKHKGDAKKLQEETMRLYKEHGINPAAGCLPMIIQFPLIMALYSVLQTAVSTQQTNIVSHINKLVYFDGLKLVKPWDQSFFGIALGQNPSHLISSVPLIVLVPVVTGLLQFIQSKMMIAPAPANKITQIKEPGKKQDSDFSTVFQSQTLFIFPLMIAYFSYSFPIGLSLYWNTFTLFGILQQYQIAGLGSLEPWLKKITRA